MVAAAVAIAVAVAGWLMGIWGGAGRQEAYYSYTLILEGPTDRKYQPIPGLARIELWSEPDGGGGYRVYYRVTAVKPLARVEAYVSIRTSLGTPPRDAANPDASWTVEHIPAGWYTEQYWAPIHPDEYPLVVSFRLYVIEG